MAPNRKLAARRSAANSPKTPPSKWVHALHWDKLNWWVAFVPGIGGAILMGAGEFLLAEVCSGIAGLIFGASVFSWRCNSLAKFWILVATVVVTGFIVLTVDYDRARADADALAARLRLSYGDLVAPEGITPRVSECTLKYPDFLYRLYLGGNTTLQKTLPQDIIRIGDRAILSVGQDNSGNIQVSLELFGSDRKILASIVNNHYEVSGAIFRKEQTDFHGFSLYDQYNVKILDIRIISKYEARITGTLFYKVGMVIDDDGLLLPGNNRISRGCNAGGTLLVIQ